MRPLAFSSPLPAVASPRSTRFSAPRPVVHVAARGQFCTRIRLRPSSTPSPAPAPHHRTTTTATATVLPSLISLASTGAGIFILGFIVFVHESGHFLAARWQRIRVRTFSIGFGPTLLRFSPKDSETEFTLRLLPLGGYVSFPEHVSVDDDTGEEVVDDDPDLLQNRPLRDRAIVVSAGVVANVLLAWAAIFSSVSAVGVPVYDAHPGALIGSIIDAQGPAAAAGLQRNDVILSVNGRIVDASLESAGSVAEDIRTSRGNPLQLLVKRDQSEVAIRLKPKCCLPDGSSSVGVQLVPNATVVRTRPSSILQSVRMTNNEFNRLFKQTWRGLSSIVTNFQRSSQNLSGPLGVVSMGADLARNDTAALLTFSAIISINLAVINALPLPALDGGQMAFLMIEAVRGTPVSTKVQDTVNRTALLMLLALSGMLLFGDIERLNIGGALQKLLQ